MKTADSSSGPSPISPACGTEALLGNERRANRKWKFAPGFTSAELLVVIFIVAILAVLFLSTTADTPAKAYRANCMNNLKQIGLVYRIWEEDYGDLYPARYFTNADGSTKLTNAFRTFQIMSNELNNPKILYCPADKERSSAADFGSKLTDLQISYFVALDAGDTFPAMWLSGDRNLVTNGAEVRPGVVTIRNTDTVTWSSKIHNGAGNIGLADGSVQQTSSANVQNLLKYSGTNLTRLAIP